MKKNVLASGLLLIVFLFTGLCGGAIENPRLIKLPLGLGLQRIENTLVMYQGRPLLIENSRLVTKNLAIQPSICMSSI